MDKNVMSKHMVLASLSIILGLISMELFKTYWASYVRFIEEFSTFKIILFQIAVVLFAEGLVVFRHYHEVVSEKAVKSTWIQIPYTIIGFLFFVYTAKYTIDFDNEFISEKYGRLLLLNIFSIYVILNELIKIYKLSWNIFTVKVSDSKDRMTILLSIIGTVISAIAILK